MKPRILLCLSVFLVACSQAPATSPTDVISKEKTSEQAAVSSLAALLSTHNILSSTDLENGFLYSVGGGAEPLSVYYHSENATGAILVTAMNVAPYAQKTAIQVVDNALYYMTSDSGIGMYNLQTGAKTTTPLTAHLNTECVSPIYGPIDDFLILYNDVVFITHECDNGSPVSRVRSLNLQTQSGQILADISEMGIDAAGFSFIRDHTSSVTVRLKSLYGDAGYIGGKIFDVNLRTGVVQNVVTISYEYCDEERVCTPEQLEENKNYEIYVPLTSMTHCGLFDLQQENDLIIHHTGSSSTIPLGTLISCFQK